MNLDNNKKQFFKTSAGTYININEIRKLTSDRQLSFAGCPAEILLCYDDYVNLCEILDGR